MNAKEFFKHYPVRKPDSNKYDNGVCLFVSGSKGMAGAAVFNLCGAFSTGASYVHCFLPQEIYPIVAQNQISSVYHPYDEKNISLFSSFSFKKIKACCFGSGMDNVSNAVFYLKELLNCFKGPLIIDAYGLKLLKENEDLYSKHNQLILTPHMGEFSVLCGKTIKEIEKDKIGIAADFSKKHNVILVLKGHETLIFNPNGEMYVNDSGNAALARAGSGDILSGMITGLCSIYEDHFQAVKDAVWLHGHLCDEALKKHSMELFDLLSYPALADAFFFKRTNVE